MEKIQKITKKCAAVVMALLLTVSGNGLIVNAAAQTEVTVKSGIVYQSNRPYTGWYSTGGRNIILLMENA